MTLEVVAELFLKIQPASAGAWYVEPLFGERLYATRSASGAFGLFLRGELADFGQIPATSSISHANDVRIEPVGVTAPMLRVIAPEKPQGNRAMVYLAYEARRLLEIDAALSNEELLRRLIWMLVLLEDESFFLSPERQRGLVGELQLLTRLVRRARALGRPPMVALDRWHGPWASKRDFSSSGIAIEAKTTSDERRIHVISSLDQLDPQEEGEEVLIYSIGVRHDRSSPRRLKHFVSDVEVLLADDEKGEFHKRLSVYGFDPARAEIYDTEPGISPFHLEPRFFREHGLVRLRPNSFAGGKPPDPVLTISYRLLLTGEPVPTSAEESLLDRLLG